jgi:hypothetical protein
VIAGSNNRAAHVLGRAGAHAIGTGPAYCTGAGDDPSVEQHQFARGGGAATALVGGIDPVEIDRDPKSLPLA